MSCSMKVLLKLLAITLLVYDGFVLDTVQGLPACSDSDSQQSLSPATGIEQSCLDDADNGVCRFFDCYERRYPCGTCGFAKEYGQNVCKKAKEPTNYNRFNDAGKRWVDATNRCLSAKMKELYQRSSVSCYETKSTMLEQMSNCFLRNEAGVSFCDIAVANREALRAVFRPGQVPTSSSIRLKVLQLGKSCLTSGTNAADLRSAFLAKIQSRLISNMG